MQDVKAYELNPSTGALSFVAQLHRHANRVNDICFVGESIPLYIYIYMDATYQRHTHLRVYMRTCAVCVYLLPVFIHHSPSHYTHLALTQASGRTVW
jgi:hypothetical protein